VKNIYRTTIIIIFSFLSFIAHSGDMGPMKEMMKQQIMTSCDDDAFLSCMGISKKKCVSTVEKALASCDKYFPGDMSAMNDEEMNKHGDCLAKSLTKYSGVSDDKANACSESAQSEPPSMDQEQAMAMMAQGLQAHAAATGTDGVTLPLYENATVMSHFANGEMAPMFKDVEQLPALVMSSPDSAEKIVGYYRKKLKGFKEYKLEDGILFMENGPKDFDITKHMPAYVSTPHVAITNDSGQSRIEIAYKKK